MNEWRYNLQLYFWEQFLPFLFSLSIGHLIPLQLHFLTKIIDKKAAGYHVKVGHSMERDIIFKIILFCDEKRSFY
jgi:hypothetical protein